MDQHNHGMSCGYCVQDDLLTFPFGEDSTTIKIHEYQPFRYNYFLNLMTAPDMNAYLLLNDDSLYNLPIHLQTLIVEAKEELVFDKDKPAQKKLERLKQFVWQRSYGDCSMLMNVLSELVSNEDELEHFIR